MFEEKNMLITLIILILSSCNIKQYKSCCIHQYVTSCVSSKMKCKDIVNLNLRIYFWMWVPVHFKLCMWLALDSHGHGVPEARGTAQWWGADLGLSSRSGSWCRKLADVSTSLCALCACGHLWCRLCGSLFHRLLESSVLGFPSPSLSGCDLEFPEFIVMLIWMRRTRCVLGYLNTPSPVGTEWVDF